MKNMKLSTKLIAGFICIALIIIVGGAVGSYGIYRTEEALKATNDVILPSVKSLAALKEAQTLLRVVEHSLLVPEFTSNGEIKNRQLANAESAWKQMEEASAVYEALPKGREQAECWSSATRYGEAWKRDYQQYLELIKANRREEAMALTDGRLRESLLAVTKTLTS
jgi:hypothetical protein